MNERIGVIGLGRMGWALAASLQRMPVIKGESDAVGFSVDGITKDAALMVAMSRDLGREATALKAALERYRAMVADGRGEQDLSTAVPYSFDSVAKART